MTGRDLSPLSAPMDDLFVAAAEAGMHTTGIGDGGNELGMGRVLPLVRAHIPRGAEIGCDTACTNLIAAGVSNWGGYALLAAVHVLRRSAGAPGLPLWSVEDEQQVLAAMSQAGAVCGISAVPNVVDGLEPAIHYEMIRTIHEIAFDS